MCSAVALTSAKSVWHWVMQNVGGVSCSPWRLTHDTRHICTPAATNRREGQQLATSSSKHMCTRHTQGTANDVINLYLYQASQNASESFRILWNVPETGHSFTSSSQNMAEPCGNGENIPDPLVYAWLSSRNWPEYAGNGEKQTK